MCASATWAFYSSCSSGQSGILLHSFVYVDVVRVLCVCVCVFLKSSQIFQGRRQTEEPMLDLFLFFIFPPRFPPSFSIYHHPMEPKGIKEQQLWQACTDGDLGTVKSLLQDKAGVDVNWVGEDRGDTPLHRCCRFGHLELVKELVSRGAGIELNKGNKGGGSPFKVACQEGHIDIVRWLMGDPRIEVTKGNLNEATPFYVACSNGRRDVVLHLLGDPRIDVTKPEVDGFTPFNIACQEGHYDIVSLMLSDPRIDPTVPSKEGGTPLLMAAFRSGVEVIALLLADPRLDANSQVVGGQTLFFMACHQGRSDLVSYLLANPNIESERPTDDKVTPFFIACEQGHQDVVALLLDDPRVDVNHVDKDQTSPLWFASQNGHLPVARFLLASEREVGTKTRSNWKNRTAAEQGRAMGKRIKGPTDLDEDHQRKATFGPLIADLIAEYENSPEDTRQELRRLPGVRECYIGRVFALVVFFSDGFVKPGPAVEPGSVASRVVEFFSLCSRLPLDLQMALCNRMFGSVKDVVSSKDSEPGFRWLARSITWLVPNDQ